jgi:hypothetical protein
MAKAKGATAGIKVTNTKRKRPGVHSKSKNSVNKTGRHWKKASRGQG